MLRQDQVPYGRLWWPVYCTIGGELLGGLQLNGHLALCAWPSPPPGVRPLRISRLTPFGPRLRRATAARSTSRGFRGGTSSGRLVLVPSDPLEKLNGALVMASPRKAGPRSCMILRLKPMEKLITLDKYLSEAEPRFCMVLGLKPMGKLITCDNYLGVR